MEVLNKQIDFQVQQKYNRLKEIIKNSGKVIIALSGGVDSTLLAKVSYDLLGENALAVIGVSPSLPVREKEDAIKLAQDIGITYKTVDTFEMNNEGYIANKGDRCYYCKSELYDQINKLRIEISFDTIFDGTNYSDLGDYRPGFKATEEKGIRKPLLEAELTKDEIRLLAHSLGLSNWDKPAFACLSSRFPKGMPISIKGLYNIEKSEDLLHQMGFKQFRMRNYNDLVRIEVVEEEINRFFDLDLRKRLIAALKELGFKYITLDLEGYKQGNTS